MAGQMRRNKILSRSFRPRGMREIGLWDSIRCRGSPFSTPSPTQPQVHQGQDRRRLGNIRSDRGIRVRTSAGGTFLQGGRKLLSQCAGAGSRRQQGLAAPEWAGWHGRLGGRPEDQPVWKRSRARDACERSFLTALGASRIPLATPTLFSET